MYRIDCTEIPPTRAPRFRRSDRPSCPFPSAPSFHPSEPPRPEKIKAELARSLLLNLRSVARTRHVARSGLDTGLSCVDRIEPVLDLQSEIVLEVVRVYE